MREANGDPAGAPGAEKPAPFGAALRRHRLAAGLTQEALAERAGVSARAVSDLERGLAHAPRRDTVARLGDALGLAGDDAAALRAAVERRRRPRAGPAAGRPAAAPGNLPADLTSFVGRDDEVAAVARLVGEHRLVTLTGAGGVGKTRLALRVARQVRSGYPGGAWFVDLAALADPALVPDGAAAALGVRAAGRPALEALRGALAPRRVLVVLDNCEHLLEACTRLVEALLRACPGVGVLATSREPLRAAGEVTWRVPSLTVPPIDGRTAREVAASTAVRLFLERAGAAAPGFVLDDANAPAVARICRRLDGVPLAIELAAVRVRTLSPEQIADRLEEAFDRGDAARGGRFQLLTAGERSALPRQRTLRASLDWSHALLAEPERALLRRLAVFAGGFTLEAAEAVCPGQGVAGADVLDLLMALVDRSLVVAELQPGAGRYRLLETIRAYARERLAGSGEAALFERRHAAHFLALAEEGEPRLWGAEQGAWFARLAAEHDNLRAALGWCLAHDPEGGLRLAVALWRFWVVRGHFGEGQRWMERLLARTGAPTLQRVRALLAAGGLARSSGDLPAARARLEEGLALARRVGDRRYIAWLLRDSGQLFLFGLRDHRRARALFEEGLAVARDAGDRRGTAVVLTNLGALARLAGDYASARAFLAEALALARATGDSFMIGGALAGSARLALVEGDFGRAEALAGEALAVARAIGLLAGELIALHVLGRAAHWQGDPEAAAARYEAALSAAREAGDGEPPVEPLVECLVFMAPVARLRGDEERATALLREGLALADGAGDPALRALARHGLGMLAASRGDHARATARLRESLRLWRGLHQPLEVAGGLEGLALAAVGLGEPARAARLLGAAAALRAAIGAPPPPIERPCRRTSSRRRGARGRR